MQIEQAQSATIAAPTRSRKNRPIRPFVSDTAISVLGFLALVSIWEGAVSAFQVPDFVLPAPSAIVTSLFQGLASGVFVRNFLVTGFQTVAGFLVAALVGTALGALVAQFAIVERVVYPWLVALQTLPKIAIAPLIIIWAGYGIGSKVIIVALVAIFPVLVNTIMGLKSCDRGKLDLMRSLGAGRWETFRVVQLPNALPFIFAGLNVAIVMAILGSIVGEFVGSKSGLGNLILEANFQFDVARIFAVLVLLGLFGVLLSQIMGFVQRRLLFWNK
ncbi:ABC transporter permease [Bradyrhizobium sp. BRP22]|uniref:ABC transporter permease n=1 Tax=Bradyrhizobium sp. BRP22 TaxID=2793821 RepID=UPI001CD1B341|nr:ABC transporter permease [Bradyrhizobium sp. BRP22]MCA1452988.1 ABC transporter permease [Bradyrhizobium sp. BRP22]